MELREATDIDLQNLWLAIKRHWLPAAAVFSCVAGISVLLVFLQKPTYEAKGKILLRKISPTTSISESSGSGNINQELEPLTSEGIPANTEIEIISSVPLAEKTIAALNLKDEDGDPLKPKRLIGNLKLKNVPSTDIVQVAYSSSKPKEAALVVNQLMSLYVENNILNNRAETVAASDFIRKQLPGTETTVRLAEVALRQFKERNQIVNLGEEARSAVTTIKELEDQITATEAASVQAKAKSAMLQKELAVNSKDVVSLNSLNQSPDVQKVLAELQQVEGSLAVLQARLKEGHPSIENLNDKRAALRALLRGQIVKYLGASRQVPQKDLQIGELKQRLVEEFVRSEVERLSLISRLDYLKKAYSAQRQRAKLLPLLEQNQQELERRVRAAQATYEILLKKQQELRVEENRNIGNSRIIENAVIPEQPLRQQATVTIGLGTVLAALLATATILVLELTDTSIKTLKEIREVFGYTLVGSIPYFGKKVASRRKKQDWTTPELPVKLAPRSPIAEAYRMLQANLKFLSSDKDLKVVVVTSAAPKEGKSTVSANLAVAIAQLERRVLLVDGDLRCPSQHHIWDLTNAAGLSNILVGQAEFDATVNEVMSNLSVLTAGVIPPNPMTLLDSQKMASLIDSFAHRYDFVIIDAPPLLAAADALTIGKMTDGVLLVAQPGIIDFPKAATARESLERSGQKVLGLVVNGVVENQPYSYLRQANESQDSQNSPDLLSSNR